MVKEDSDLELELDLSVLRFHAAESHRCGVFFAARALLAIKAALHDPGQVLRDWDPKSGAGHDPCRWSMVTCHEGHVQKLYALCCLVIAIGVCVCCHDVM